MIITKLTKTESGTYDESHNIAPDMLAGGEEPSTIEDALWWLSEEGYRDAEGFEGWGAVVRHEESGDLLAVSI